MSAQTMREAWAPVEVRDHELVARHTFGHLAPNKGKSYKGELLFTQSEYGDLIPIRCNFRGLDDSPWLYDALLDFVDKHAKKSGKIYKFTGMICNYEFIGKVEQLPI